MVPRAQPKANRKAGNKAKATKQKGNVRGSSKPGIGHNSGIEPDLLELTPGDPPSNPREAKKRLSVRLGERSKTLHPPPLDPAVAATTAPYVAEIHAVHKRGVEDIFKIGDILIPAKKELAYGAFLHMIDKELPWSRRYAQMHKQVAEHKILREVKWISRLPASVAVLWELTSIPDDNLVEMREDGTINPGLTRGEVVEMRNRLKQTGSYLAVEDLKKALIVLERFQEKYPDPDKKTETARDPLPLAYLLARAWKVLDPDLVGMSKWLTELATAHKRHFNKDYDDDDDEEDEEGGEDDEQAEKAAKATSNRLLREREQAEDAAKAARAAKITNNRRERAGQLTERRREREEQARHALSPATAASIAEHAKEDMKKDETA